MSATVEERARSAFGPPMQLRRGRWLISPAGGVLLGLIWLAIALVHVWSQPIDHDARGYTWVAATLVDGRAGSGVPEQYLDVLFGIRLMGYPLVLSPFVALALGGLKLRLAVAILQLFLYWGAVVLVRSGLSRLVNADAARRVTFALLATPFPYLLIVELVTESLSIALALASSGSVMRGLAAERSSARISWSACACACAGAAMLVRTDNLFVAVLCAVGLVGVVRSLLPASLRLGRAAAAAVSGMAVAASVLLFRIPQLLLLRRHTGTGSWDTPTELATTEFKFGVGTLKWATGIGDVSGGFPYRNPFLTASMVARYGDNPLEWYLHEPIRGVALVAVKWFALLDQDVPFVYNESLPGRPNPVWFVLNHVIVFVGVLGLWKLVRATWDRGLDEPARWFAGALTIAAVAWLATHALPHVESRYGLPALVALSACAGLWVTPERVRSRLRLLVVGLVIYLPLAWLTSTWLISYRSGPI